jgi:hypothetical protein
VSVVARLPAIRRNAEKLRRQGHPQRAHDLLVPALDVTRDSFGPEHPDTLETMRLLALTEYDLHNLTGARRVLEEALAAGRYSLGEADRLMLLLSAQLGGVADELGNRYEARRAYERVARLGPDVLGVGHPAVADAGRYLDSSPTGRVSVYAPPPEVIPPVVATAPVRSAPPVTPGPPAVAPPAVAPPTVAPPTVAPPTVAPPTVAPPALAVPAPVTPSGTGSDPVRQTAFDPDYGGSATDRPAPPGPTPVRPDPSRPQPAVPPHPRTPAPEEQIPPAADPDGSPPDRRPPGGPGRDSPGATSAAGDTGAGVATSPRVPPAPASTADAAVHGPMRLPTGTGTREPTAPPPMGNTRRWATAGPTLDPPSAPGRHTAADADGTPVQAPVSPAGRHALPDEPDPALDSPAGALRSDDTRAADPAHGDAADGRSGAGYTPATLDDPGHDDQVLAGGRGTVPAHDDTDHPREEGYGAAQNGADEHDSHDPHDDLDPDGAHDPDFAYERYDGPEPDDGPDPRGGRTLAPAEDPRADHDLEDRPSDHDEESPAARDLEDRPSRHDDGDDWADDGWHGPAWGTAADPVPVAAAHPDAAGRDRDGEPAPGYPPDGHARHPAGDADPAGWSVSGGSGVYRPDRPLPAPAPVGYTGDWSDRLPVPVSHAAAPGRSRTLLVALVAVGLVALASVGAATITWLAARHARVAATAPTPQPSPSATAAQPSPSPSLPAPTGLQVSDEGSTVSLAWQDPAGGTVPFMIAGGHAGETLRAFQSVQPGVTSYTVRGLNPKLDYCFTVIAVYGTDRIGTSDLACTSRLGPPASPPS